MKKKLKYLVPIALAIVFWMGLHIWYSVFTGTRDNGMNYDSGLILQDGIVKESLYDGIFKQRLNTSIDLLKTERIKYVYISSLDEKGTSDSIKKYYTDRGINDTVLIFNHLDGSYIAPNNIRSVMKNTKEDLNLKSFIYITPYYRSLVSVMLLDRYLGTGYYQLYNYKKVNLWVDLKDTTASFFEFYRLKFKYIVSDILYGKEKSINYIEVKE